MSYNINQVSHMDDHDNACPQCGGVKWVATTDSTGRVVSRPVCPTCLGTGQQKVPYEVAWDGPIPNVGTTCENRNDLTDIGDSKKARIPGDGGL